MPFTKTQRTILTSLIKKHGEEEGTRIFYMSLNKGVIPGPKHKRRRHHAK